MSDVPAVATASAAPETWAALLPVPCTLVVEATVAGFTVGDLLTLSPGSVVRTAHKQHAPVGIYVDRQRIALAEFEVVNDRLAVRLSELT